MATVIQNLVSTIIPVHNRPDLLREAVSSVLAQSYRPIEIIIIDDGSDDDTPLVADQLASAHTGEIRVIHQRNQGVGLARETGRQQACGEFIQYLDSDDILLPRKFELQISALRAHPDCVVAYGMTAFASHGNTPLPDPWKRTGERFAAMFPSFLLSRWWDTSTPLYRRSICDRAGPWLELSNEEDWEYDCRVASLGASLCYVDEFVSHTREHGGHRLSRGGAHDPRKLRDRARAHELILGHAQRAGIRSEQPEMQHFARALFLLARQCGATGLAAEARQLFLLSRQAAGEKRGAQMDYRIYELFAKTAGWTRAGSISCWVDQWRR